MNMYLFLTIYGGEPSDVYGITEQYNVYRVMQNNGHHFRATHIAVMYSLYSILSLPHDRHIIRMHKIDEWQPCSLKDFFGEE